MRTNDARTAGISVGGGTVVVLSTSCEEVNLGSGTTLDVRFARPFTTVVPAD
jgi:hypothetical protein